MLFLTRRIGEQVILTLEDGRDIVIKMQEIRGRQAMIGIEAPKEISILRSEIVERIYRQKREEDRLALLESMEV